ncbi:MAG: hypothetical protein Q9227_009496 [Pyrenula ochraceoflavens]
MVFSLTRCEECQADLDADVHKCRQCKSFIYCSNCLVHAHLLHPGHDFEAILTSDETCFELEGNGNSDSYRGVSESFMEDAFVPLPEETARVCMGCFPMTMPTSRIIFDKVLLPDKYKDGQSVSYVCHVRLSKLVAGMQRKCAFCSLILHRFIGSDPSEERNGGVHSLFYEVPKLWYASFSAQQDAHAQRSKLAARCMNFLTKMESDTIAFQMELCRKRDSSSLDFDGMTIGVADDEENDEFFVKNFTLPSALSALLKLDVSTSDSCLPGKTITSRPPNASLSSEQGFGRVRKWLSTCQQSHQEMCAMASEGVKSLLPSLVVDVSDPEKLRIYKSAHEERGDYCALSYCWGGPQTFQTTSATYADRLDGFFVTDLPRTLQDAVKLTRELGIRYLWVDSICIIQDSEDHRTEQLSQMGDIYMNATLTICAARCFKADDSFLENSADPVTGVHQSLVFFNILQAETIEGSPGSSAKALVKSVGNLWLMEADPGFLKDPISHRGWCLQESILSPRVVYYDRLRPIWRCNGCVEVDGGPEVERGILPQYQRKLNSAILESRRRELSINLQGEASKDISYNQDMDRTTILKDIHRCWQRTLEEYTMRELSFDHDKFRAIGGIATEIAKLTGDHYMAGLWRRTCLHDLMWTTKKDEWLHRPRKRRAPTWSWASTNCPIRYDAVTDDAIPVAAVLQCNVSRPESARSEELTPLTLPNVPEYGQAELVIRGPLKKLSRNHAKSLIHHSHAAPGPDTVDRLPLDQNIFGHMHQTSGSSSSGSNQADHKSHRMFYYYRPPPEPNSTSTTALPDSAAQAVNKREERTADVLHAMAQNILSGKAIGSYEETERELLQANASLAPSTDDDFPENAYLLVLFVHAEPARKEAQQQNVNANANANANEGDHLLYAYAYAYAYAYSGLILTKRADGAFERIGSFANESYRLYHAAAAADDDDVEIGLEEREITIV